MRETRQVRGLWLFLGVVGVVTSIVPVRLSQIAMSLAVVTRVRIACPEPDAYAPHDWPDVCRDLGATRSTEWYDVTGWAFWKSENVQVVRTRHGMQSHGWIRPDDPRVTGLERNFARLLTETPLQTLVVLGFIAYYVWFCRAMWRLWRPLA